MIKFAPHILNELSDEYRDNWKSFVIDLINIKGQNYYNDMIKELDIILHKHWWNQYDKPNRGQELLNFNKQYPELIEYMRQTLKQQYGSAVILYRGIRLSENVTDFKNILLQFINGRVVILESFSGMTVFSWTHQIHIARNFATDYTTKFNYGIVFVAQVPVEQIVFAGPTTLALADSVIASEFIVHHFKPLEAVVQSKITEDRIDDILMRVQPNA